jgi:hypothetical protein
MYDRIGENLLLVTARCDGHLVGYFLWFLIMHPHYRNVSVAEEDLHFLLPEYRRGLAICRAEYSDPAEFEAAAIAWLDAYIGSIEQPRWKIMVRKLAMVEARRIYGELVYRDLVSLALLRRAAAKQALLGGEC